MVDGMIRIKESDPETDLIFSPTVPITCVPPCSTTLEVDLTKSVGLKLSECSVSWVGDQDTGDKTVTMKSLKSSGSFSRVARIVFSDITTSPPGLPWNGYKPAHCPVCARL